MRIHSFVLLVTFLGIFAQNIYASEIYTYTVEAPARTNCKLCGDRRMGDKNFCENRDSSSEFWSQRNPKGYTLVGTTCDWHNIDPNGNKVEPGNGDATCICEYRPN